MSRQDLVVDASALVDLLLGEVLGEAVAARVEGAVLHAPAHVDAEVLSGLGRLHRSGRLTASAVGVRLSAMAAAPVARHPLANLIGGAWERRGTLRVADALYVELAAGLAAPLLTTDARLARAVPLAEVVTA